MKHVCENFIFNKAVGWRHNINIKSLIQLHFFLLRRSQQNQRFLHHLYILFLLMTRKSSTCLHSANIIFNLGSFGDDLWKNLKTKRDKILLQDILWKKLPSWNTTDFTDYLNYITALKQFVIFLFIRQCIHCTPFDWFYYFRKLFSKFVFLKEIVFRLLFLSAMSERQKREHYQWKLKVSSLNLKKLFTKFNLIDFSCSNKSF